MSGGRRILLADDHEAIRLLLRALLERRGHACVLAEDGVAAVAAVAAGGIDLVLMDCAMPRMDGWAAARAIRARERAAGAPRLPIIALTALALPEDLERSRAAGMDGHLVKPVAEAELAAAIARALPGGAGPGAPASPPAEEPAPAAVAPPMVLVADDRPAAAAAAVDVLDRLGVRALAAAWDPVVLAAAPAVLVAARGDGGAAAALVRALGGAPTRPLILASVPALRHPAVAAVEAAAPDALLLRPLQAPLLARALGRRFRLAPPPPGRPLVLPAAAGPGPDLVLDTLHMVEHAQPGTAEAMLRAFAADLAQAEADLADAAADRLLLAALAHRIRGGAAALGAAPLAGAAAALELVPADGDPAPALAGFIARAADFRAAAAIILAG